MVSLVRPWPWGWCQIVIWALWRFRNRLTIYKPFKTDSKESIKAPGPFMMTSSNAYIFRVAGHLCGEFTVHRSLFTKASDAELWCFLWAWINGWVNNREAGDLRRHRAHYDVTVLFAETPSTTGGYPAIGSFRTERVYCYSCIVIPPVLRPENLRRTRSIRWNPMHCHGINSHGTDDVA